MSRKSPAFSFYPDSWIAGTSLMGRAEKGLYIDMLAQIWLHGCLTREQLMRCCFVVPGTADESLLDGLLAEKFAEVDGRFSNTRLEEERAKQRARAEAGSKGGKNTQKKRKQNDKQNESKASSKRSSKNKGSDSDSDSDSVTNTKTPPKPPEGEDDWVLPDGWNTPELLVALSEFEAMRRSIRKPIRDRRRTSANFKRFESPEHLLYAVEHCTANDYQGIRPEYRPPANSVAKATPASRVATAEDLANWQPTGMDL